MIHFFVDLCMWANFKYSCRKNSFRICFIFFNIIKFVFDSFIFALMNTMHLFLFIFSKKWYLIVWYWHFFNTDIHIAFEVYTRNPPNFEVITPIIRLDLKCYHKIFWSLQNGSCQELVKNLSKLRLFEGVQSRFFNVWQFDEVCNIICTLY